LAREFDRQIDNGKSFFRFRNEQILVNLCNGKLSLKDQECLRGFLSTVFKLHDYYSKAGINKYDKGAVKAFLLHFLCHPGMEMVKAFEKTIIDEWLEAEPGTNK
jgi:hypothetical protein